MTKFRAFFDAAGAFFLWCWKYPTTPKENFQDARFRYMMNTDPEMIKIQEDLDKELRKRA